MNKLNRDVFDQYEKEVDELTFIVKEEARKKYE